MGTPIATHKVRRFSFEITPVVWSYFTNSSGDHEAAFATHALWEPIFRDIGATLPP